MKLRGKRLIRGNEKARRVKRCVLQVEGFLGQLPAALKVKRRMCRKRADDSSRESAALSSFATLDRGGLRYRFGRLCQAVFEFLP